MCSLGNTQWNLNHKTDTTGEQPFGRYREVVFIAKADWGLRKLLVVWSREVAVPERLLYIVVSIRT